MNGTPTAVPEETPEVIVDDALKAQLANCKPGQVKSYSVTAMMGDDGTVTLSPDMADNEESEVPPPKVLAKKTIRPPVIAAVMPA